VKEIDLFEILTQIGPFVGAQNPQREANHCPQVHHRVTAAVMLAEFMNLGVAVVATGNAIVGARLFDLLIFDPAVFKALLFESGLEETAAAAAAKIVGPIGLHVDEIFLTHHRLDHKAEIFGDGIAVTLAYDLTRVLHREFKFQIRVPVRTDLEFAFADPFGIVFIDIFDLKVVGEIEFFQSGPD
jgi:hypothetical protein